MKFFINKIYNNKYNFILNWLLILNIFIKKF